MAGVGDGGRGTQINKLQKKSEKCQTKIGEIERGWFRLYEHALLCHPACIVTSPQEEGCCELLLPPRWGRDSSQICEDRLMIIFQLFLFYIKIHKLSFILFQLSFIQLLYYLFNYLLFYFNSILFYFNFILLYFTILFYFFTVFYSVIVELCTCVYMYYLLIY